MVKAHGRSRGSQPLSPARKLLFSCIALGGILALAEFAAYAGLSFVVDGGRPLAALEASRASLASGESPGDGAAVTQAEAGRRAPLPTFIQREVLHPYLGFVRAPQRHGAERISDYGFPGKRSPLVRRSPDELIVGIFGGSVAMNFGKQGVKALERALRSAHRLGGRSIRFVRTALGGFKQPQQLMTLDYLMALGGEFDWIINLDGFNEIALHPVGNAKQGVAAIYPRNWSLRVRDVPDPKVRRWMGQVSFLEDRRVRLGQTFSRFPWRFSPLANRVWYTRDRLAARAISELELKLEGYRTGESPYVVTGPAQGGRGEEAMYADLVQIWKRSSILLDALCRALEIHFHDLTKVFEDHPETIYVDCCHLNQRGNDLLAARIGAEILKDLGPG